MKRHRRLHSRWYRLGFGLALGATAGLTEPDNSGRQGRAPGEQSLSCWERTL